MRRKRITKRVNHLAGSNLKRELKFSRDLPNKEKRGESKVNVALPKKRPTYREPKDSGPVRFMNSEGDPVNLEGVYKERPVFMILSGPSLNLLDLSEIRRVGAQSFGVNNSWSVYKPDFWTCADSPDRFLFSRWQDPNIMKLCPSPLRHKKLKIKKEEEFYVSDLRPRDCPNTFFYSRNLEFDHLRFLDQNTVNWGAPGDKRDTLGLRGGRSVMLSAFKLCYVLGFRTIYLCGADFKMEEGAQNYAFPQERSKSSVRGNNSSYNINSKRMSELNKLFLKSGLKVYNCNPESQLFSFPKIPFVEAIANCEDLIPPDEGSLGWYNKECVDKKDKVKIKRN